MRLEATNLTKAYHAHEVVNIEKAVSQLMKRY